MNELPAFLGVPDMCGDQKKAEKSEIFEESPCYQMLQWQMFSKIFSKGVERGANFKNWPSVIRGDWNEWHRKRKSVGISRVISISDYISVL